MSDEPTLRIDVGGRPEAIARANAFLAVFDELVVEGVGERAAIAGAVTEAFGAGARWATTELALQLQKQLGVRFAIYDHDGPPDTAS